MRDFVVDLDGVFDEVGDVFADDLAELGTETAQGGADAAFGHAVAGDELSLHVGEAFGVEHGRTKEGEALALAEFGLLCGEAVEGVFDDRLRPASVIDGLGADQAVGERGIVVDAEMNGVGAAAFLRGAVAMPGEHEVAQCGEQVGAEAAIFGTDTGGEVFFDEVLEVALGDVLSVFVILAAAAHVGVERLPIFAAELLQRLLTARRAGISGLQDEGPARGVERLTHGRDS